MQWRIQKILANIRSYFGWNNANDAFEKVQVILITFMQLAFVGAFLFALVEGAWIVAFVSVAAIVAVWFPLFFVRSKQVDVPIAFQFLLNIFIYAALFLGEISGFYTRFWWWDAVLHTGSAIALGFIGFLIMYSLYRSGRMSMNPGLFALFSFTFALSLGALWEVFEFIGDSILDTTMQKSGLVDTMWDLIVDALGALLAAVSGYFYIKHEKRGVGVFRYYLHAYLEKNK